MRITARSSQGFIEAVWDRRHWQRGSPGSVALRAWKHKLRCAGSANRRAMQKHWQVARLRYGRWRAYRQLAPEPGFVGEGRWLRWLPVPRYVIECETRGYHGEGRWLAMNPSGASGPAQLLDHGQPYPAETDAERLAYWRIAAYVLQTEGLSAWACA